MSNPNLRHLPSSSCSWLSFKHLNSHKSAHQPQVLLQAEVRPLLHVTSNDPGWSDCSRRPALLPGKELQK